MYGNDIELCLAFLFRQTAAGYSCFTEAFWIASLPFVKVYVCVLLLFRFCHIGSSRCEIRSISADCLIVYVEVTTLFLPSPLLNGGSSHVSIGGWGASIFNMNLWFGFHFRMCWPTVASFPYSIVIFYSFFNLFCLCGSVHIMFASTWGLGLYLYGVC